ncbi:MAG TPA: isoleucine--tRNA ligase [Halanaerobiales bacterium]|nr:isoleucine--tRNA ligase [Halanaerobiales bacterium]
MGYKETINLPNTDFPMRANLTQREPELEKYWEDSDIYNKAVTRRKRAETFILHDGPPYANGDIHMGHALNQVLKDIVTRYKTLKGFYSPYVPGWDTHGLPIEHKVSRELGDKAKELSIGELRKRCAEYALKYVERQREQFKRLGVWGEWDNPYLTLKPEYEVKQIEVFGAMAKKDLFYKGKKPVYWCPDCETALAEAEVDYNEVRSPSIYVKFPLRENIHVGGVELSPEDSYVVIWTTTPWTIPANLAITLHPDFDYTVVKVKEEKMVMARELVDQVMQENDINDYEIIGESFKGSILENIKCKHPIEDRDSLIILGDHVTLEQGTGCVHTAPGHGHEDYLVGMEYDLDIYAPMDSRGFFTKESGRFNEMHYEQVNKEVTSILKENGLLLNLSFISHQYPHCWRCDGPLLFRATNQWFASIDAIKEEALQSIRDVEWFPKWGEVRMSNMVAERSDWCISRQKRWGVPLPIFYCNDCGESIINDDTLDTVKELFAREGSGSWYKYSAKDILPENYKCPECGGQSFTKEEDIMDVWFDSGSSHRAVLTTRDNLSWPSQLYLEGTDQYRGWFNSSLLTAVATEGRAPYDAVVTNGFVVDDKGIKMSKSVGNVISPHDVVEEYGADIIRLWVASSDFKEDVKVSTKILKQNSEVYRRIRNTFRFMLGNIYDFKYGNNYVPYKERKGIDRWIMIRLQELVKKINRAYDTYEYHRVYHDIHNFCTIEMSSLYVDIVKDRLYTDGTTSLSRRAVQSTLYDVLITLVKLIAPVLVHTAEEVWQHIPDKDKEAESVFLSDWPELKENYYEKDLMESWEKMLAARKDVAKALEIARADKKIGNSLEAKVVIVPANEKQGEFLDKNKDELADLFIVSQVEFGLGLEQFAGDSDSTVHQGSETGLKVAVINASGSKCERCWKYSETVGSDKAHPDLCERCLGVVKE